MSTCDNSPRIPKTTAEDIKNLRDFSAEIPYLKEIREDYLRWRAGGSTGMKGNMDTISSLHDMIKELEDAARDAEEKKEVHQTDENPQDVFVWRKQARDMYRKNYAKWRKGLSEGVTPAMASLGLSPDARRDRALF
jgi:hypothetical protein